MKFTIEDRQILEMCMRHNLGYRLLESVQHLLDDYDSLVAESKASYEVEKTG